MKNILSAITLGFILFTNTFYAEAQSSVADINGNDPICDSIYSDSLYNAAAEIDFIWAKQRYDNTINKFVNDSIIASTNAVIQDRLSKLPVEIEMPYNSIQHNYISGYINNNRRIRNMLKLGQYYMPIFEYAYEKEGIPLELKYLSIVESLLDPTANSIAAASGLFQFIPSTAKEYDFEMNEYVDERRSPLKMAKNSAKYLNKLYANQEQDWSFAISAYNRGPGSKTYGRGTWGDRKKAIRAGDSDDNFWDIYKYIPSKNENRGYFPSFVAATYAMNYYALHNINPTFDFNPVITDTVQVTKRMHFSQISDVIGVPVEELQILNPQYQLNVIPGDKHPYILTLQSKYVGAFIVNHDSIANHNLDKYKPHLHPKSKKYTIKRKDTYSSIANKHSKYGITLDQIRAWNSLPRLSDKSAINFLDKFRRGKLKRYYGRNHLVIYYANEDNDNKNKDHNIYEPEDKKIEDKKDFDKDTIELIIDTVDNKKDIAIIEPEIVDSITEEIDSVDSVNIAELKPEIVDDAEIEIEEEINEDLKKEFKEEVVDPVEIDITKDKKLIIYEVKRGNKLALIARDHGVTIAQIKEWNNLNTTNIQIGQKLKIYVEKDFETPSLGKLQTYTVKKGDKLAKIAEMYEVSVDDIMEWNRLRDANSINVGQSLKIYSDTKPIISSDKKGDYTVHTVAKGDKLSLIAQEYGVNVEQILEWNNLKSTNIKVGQKLKIKGTTKSAPKTKTKTTTYTVKKGDKLSLIAEEYGVTVKQILEWNNLKSTNIKVGQKLKIKTGSAPKTNYVTHVVKKGEKLAKIAEKYGVTLVQIKKWNNIQDINKVQIGQKLKIYPNK